MSESRITRTQSELWRKLGVSYPATASLGRITASASDAMAMARRLAREDAFFAGASSGANVVAALRLA